MNSQEKWTQNGWIWVKNELDMEINEHSEIQFPTLLHFVYVMTDSHVVICAVCLGLVIHYHCKQSVQKQ